MKEAVFNSLEMFTEKHLHLSLFFVKKRLQYFCFPVNIVKFLRTSSFEEHLRMVAYGNMKSPTKI